VKLRSFPSEENLTNDKLTLVPQLVFLSIFEIILPKMLIAIGFSLYSLMLLNFLF